MRNIRKGKEEGKRRGKNSYKLFSHSNALPFPWDQMLQLLVSGRLAFMRCEEPSDLYREGPHERGLDEDSQASSFAVVLED